MSIEAVAGICLVAAALAVLLKQHNPEYAMLISIGVGVIVLISLIGQVRPAVMQVSSLVSGAGLSAEYGGILFKSLGICFLTQLAGDSCRDVGQTAMASKIELAGKIAILVISLPLFAKIAELAVSLING